MFVLEAALRSFPEIAPRCYRKEFPLFVEDETLDPAKLRTPGPTREAPADRDRRVLELLEGESKPQSTRWVRSELGMSGNYAKDALVRLHGRGQVECFDAKSKDRLDDVPEGQSVLWLRVGQRGGTGVVPPVPP